MGTNVSIAAPQTTKSAGLRIAAWATTGLFAALMTFSGVMYVIGPKTLMEAMSVLGYPPYFLKMLGAAKIAGAAALLIPRPLTVREWAYAGFTFDLCAAVVSHLASGDAAHLPPALLVLALLMGSYFSRRRLAAAPAHVTF